MWDRLNYNVHNARAAGRAFWRTGMLFRLQPRGLFTLLHGQVTGRTGPSLMHRVHAQNQPHHEAVVCGDRRLTFHQLEGRINRLADGLHRKHGIGAGDSVLLIMENRLEILETQAAMSRLGGAAVCASWRTTPSELDFLIADSGAKAIIIESDLADGTLGPRRDFIGIPRENLITVGGTHAELTHYDQIVQSGREHANVGDGSGGALVIYTSGTTGKPKGAVRKFPKEAAYAIFHFLAEAPIRSDDRHLAVCPMYHSTAVGFITFTFVVGGTVVVQHRFDPEEVLAAIERERITTTVMVPTMLHRILELPERTVARYDTRSLRAVFSGGAPLTGSLARRFIDRFGHILYNIYGSTETGVNTLATPEELLLSPGTIGHAVDGNEIRLLSDDGGSVNVGETGELWVRNTMLIEGYHGQPSGADERSRDGFFSVGDLAHVDEHGLFHIDGRKKDMIISGGVNVYPAEVEETLCRHGAIAEAAVVGVPDDEWGERVRAFVSLHDSGNTTAEAIIAWAKHELSGPKVPREVIILDELPKNPTGKILKRELRVHSAQLDDQT